MRAFILILVLALVVLGQTPPPLQAPLGPDTVVAIVDGVSVTVADIQKMLEIGTPQLTQMFQQKPQEAIKQVFLMRHLAAEGEKAKLAERSPIKEQLEFMRANLLAGLMVNQERDGYAVPGEDIDKFYALNQSRWTQAKVKIIFIGFKPAVAGAPKAETKPAVLKPEDIADAARNAFSAAHSPNQRSEEEASKLASELVKQLRAGADFGKLVEQYSDDSSSKGSGGDFGAPITPTSAYSEDFKQPILAQMPGTISDPLKQPNGFYIVRVEEKSTQPLNDVREAIIQELRQNHRDQYMKDLSNRFQPAVLRPDFFLQPGQYLSPQQPAPAKKP